MVQVLVGVVGVLILVLMAVSEVAVELLERDEASQRVAGARHRRDPVNSGAGGAGRSEVLGQSDEHDLAA